MADFDIYNPSTYDLPSPKGEGPIRNYSYAVTIKRADPNGNELEPTYVTISTDDVLTPDQITSTALTLASKYQGFEQSEVTEVIITSAMRKRGIGI